MGREGYSPIRCWTTEEDEAELIPKQQGKLGTLDSYSFCVPEQEAWTIRLLEEPVTVSPQDWKIDGLVSLGKSAASADLR